MDEFYLDRSYAVFEIEGAAGEVVGNRLAPHGIPVYRTGRQAIAVVEEVSSDVEALLESKGFEYSSVEDIDDADLDSWFNEQDWQEPLEID